jgi:hypothetical protein
MRVVSVSQVGEQLPSRERDLPTAETYSEATSFERFVCSKTCTEVRATTRVTGWYNVWVGVGGYRIGRPAPHTLLASDRSSLELADAARVAEHTTVGMGAGWPFGWVPWLASAGYCGVSVAAANRKARQDCRCLRRGRCRVAPAMDKVDQMPDSIVDNWGDGVVHWLAPVRPGVQMQANARVDRSVT